MQESIQNLAREEVELEMTPMIDVTFLLLIFFMCTIKFKSLEGKLAAYLPKEVGTSPTPSEPLDPILASVKVVNPGHRVQAAAPGESWDGLGDFILKDHKVSYQLGRKQYDSGERGLESMREDLRGLLDADPGRKVKLDIGSGVVHSDVIGLLDLCSEVGATDLVFKGK